MKEKQFRYKVECERKVLSQVSMQASIFGIAFGYGYGYGSGSR
jgi:hypothetical protein